jgi:phospholipid/cholesterol/gamma-HCH transport system substrate-binding protein
LRHSRSIGRALAVAALVVAIAVVSVVLLRGDGADYRINARFTNASQLVKGNEVQVAGVAIGTVGEIDLAPNGGRARAPGHHEPRVHAAAPRDRGRSSARTSLSGIANRYVDLRLPGGDARPIEDGGELPTVDTTSAVDLDQLLSALDGKSREDLQGVVQGFGKQIDGKSREAARGYMYLNPSLASSSRLFEELNRDTPELENFIQQNARLVTTLASKREDLTGLVTELSDFTGALGRERTRAGRRHPPAAAVHCAAANSTFVNLARRSTTCARSSASPSR